MLPGVAGICMFMLVLTLINAFAALRGSFGDGRGKYGVLMLCTLLGAGVKLTRLDKDLREADVEMRLTRWNKNYVGVHFGGSLFSMTDPFYMLMLAANLGDEFVVWDKAASIRYRKPGKGRVRAEFRLSDERLAEIRAALEAEGRYDAQFVVEIKDAEGGVIAVV